MGIGKRMLFGNLSRSRFSNLTQGTRPVPESKGLPVIGTTLAILAAGGAPKLHLYIDKRHKEHGVVILRTVELIPKPVKPRHTPYRRTIRMPRGNKHFDIQNNPWISSRFKERISEINHESILGSIFREKLGPVPGVFISDGNYIRKIFAAEGRYPKHIIPESWAIYNQIYGCKRGLLFMDGEEWSHFRKLLNTIMLRDNDAEFVKASSIVAKKLVREWSVQEIIQNLEARLYKWSLEVIVAILMGGETYQEYNEDVADDITNLSKVIHQVFIESGTLSLMPARLAVTLKLPVWKRFVRAVSTANDSGLKLLQLIIKLCDKYPQKRGLLYKIRETGIEHKDLSRIVTDLILAAADTTSYTMQWLLHILSVNGHIQKSIQEELDGVEESEATSCSLLKGALKESLRLYPVAPFITRYMPESLILDGYEIKSGELVLMSMYSSGRDERYFPHPNSFSPGRWLRNVRGYESVNNANASLPFAIGSRSCIGKKIAETQILITLYHILKNFRVTTTHSQPIGITLHLIAVPEKPLNLILKLRTEE